LHPAKNHPNANTTNAAKACNFTVFLTFPP
jgi:hypothetical protein